MVNDGYAIYENVFTASECADLAGSISDSGRFSRAGVRSLMSLKYVADLASDQRLLTICREISGVGLLPYKATLFNKTGKANWLVAWHQDTALPVDREFNADGWGPFTKKAGVLFTHAPTEILRKIVALRIHLDASTPANGPLRVVPGSHRKPITDDIDFRNVIQSGPQVELTVGRGGVIAMSPLLIHASSKSAGDEPRRVIHVEYAESRDIAPGIRLATA